MRDWWPVFVSGFGGGVVDGALTRVTCVPRPRMTRFEGMYVPLAIRFSCFCSSDSIRLLTGERLKLADQQARLHLSCNVEISRLREGGDVRLGNENLAGLKQQRFAETIRQITSDGSFQDKHLDVELAMTLDYGRRTCARDRDRSGLDLQAVSAFGYLEKHCTFAKIYGACSVAETDTRFRSETRDRLVRESQFAAPDHAGLDRITVTKAFTDCDPAWHCLGRT